MFFAVGAGSAARLSLPFGVRGKPSSTMIVEGTMYAGQHHRQRSSQVFGINRHAPGCYHVTHELRPNHFIIRATITAA